MVPEPNLVPWTKIFVIILYWAIFSSHIIWFFGQNSLDTPWSTLTSDSTLYSLHTHTRSRAKPQIQLHNGKIKNLHNGMPQSQTECSYITRSIVLLITVQSYRQCTLELCIRYTKTYIVYRVSYITIHIRWIRKIYDTYTILRRFVVYKYIIVEPTYSMYYVLCMML